MERYRLISSIVFLFVYLLMRYPWQTIVITGILVIAYFAVSNIGSSTMIERNSRTERRKIALKTCSIYLSPYNNIWKNLKLSNKFCSLRLGSISSSITARDSQNPHRSFKIIYSNTHSYEDLWNMFCCKFSYNTTFDELIQLAGRFEAEIEIKGSSVDKTPNNNKCNTENNETNTIYNEEKNKEKKGLLDVNNASEVELTALPGVNIVMAKKLIKKREEIGGFKNINDVCLFLHLKPHIQTQLEKLICVKKMQGSLKISRYDERSVDI